ncbi:MAG: DUF2959 domain-containing protein [Cellvibrionaceae bacterium]
MKLNVKLGVALLAVAMMGCESAYYNTMENFGVHKRDILVDRVVDARDAQQDAQEQFTSALDEFKAVVSIDGGKLEKAYNRLNNEYEASEESADLIRERISSIESVAGALFKEWEAELKQYSSASLKRESQSQLSATRSKYRQLLSVMRNAESRLTPVLNSMRDQVLYLKHNLNARAIQSLKGEVVTINRDVDNLLAAMEKAIAEADDFIREMKVGS